MRFCIRRQHHIQQRRGRRGNLDAEPLHHPLRRVGKFRFILLFILAYLAISTIIRLDRLHLRHPGIAEFQGVSIHLQLLPAATGGRCLARTHHQLHAVEQGGHIRQRHRLTEENLQQILLLIIRQAPLHPGTQLRLRSSRPADGILIAEAIALPGHDQQMPFIIQIQRLGRAHHHMSGKYAILLQCFPDRLTFIRQHAKGGRYEPLLHIGRFRDTLHAVNIIALISPESTPRPAEHKARMLLRGKLHILAGIQSTRAHHDAHAPLIHDTPPRKPAGRHAERQLTSHHRGAAQVGGARLYLELVLRLAGSTLRVADFQPVLVHPAGNGLVLVIPGQGEDMPPQISLRIDRFIRRCAVTHHRLAHQRL